MVIKMSCAIFVMSHHCSFHSNMSSVIKPSQLVYYFSAASSLSHTSTDGCVRPNLQFASQCHRLPHYDHHETNYFILPLCCNFISTFVCKMSKNKYLVHFSCTYVPHFLKFPLHFLLTATHSSPSRVFPRFHLRQVLSG